ncbi:MAG: response regulator transcription factor [Siphonobacter sp.]
MYQVIIVDDEPPARDILEVFIGRIPNLTCVAVCANVYQALAAMEEHKPDLVFLDIQMPELTGMDLLGMPMPHSPVFILTTAYSQYAVDSYNFKVIDYLLKPIAFERFVKAILKFKESKASTDEVMEVNESFSHTKDSVWIREEKRLLQIPFEEVVYLEGMKDYVKVFLKDQMIMSHMGLGKAEELFIPPTFVRIHRSYLVRLSAIRVIDGNTVLLDGGIEVPIGPHYREMLKKTISALG